MDKYEVKETIGHIITTLGDFPLEPDSGSAWLWSADGTQMLWSSNSGARAFGGSQTIGSTPLLSTDRFSALAADLRQSQPDQLPVRVQQITLRNGDASKSFTCLSRAVPLRAGGYGMLAVAIGAATRAVSPPQALPPQPEEKNPPRRAFRVESPESVETSTHLENSDRREIRMRDLRQSLKQDLASIGASKKEVSPIITAPKVETIVAATETSPTPEVSIPVIAKVWSNTWANGPSSNRHPLRFVWQTDAAGRFVHLSRELTDAVGPSNAMIMGQTMPQVAERIGILEADDIQSHMASKDTWAAKAALWPVENSDLAIPVEMAGMPVTEQGQFVGFRGYGIARIERAVPLPSNVAQALAADEIPNSDETLTRFGPAIEKAVEIAATEKPIVPDVPKAKRANPLPLLPDVPAVNRITTAKPIEAPAKPLEGAKDSLSTSEREAFREIARALEKTEQLEKSKLEKQRTETSVETDSDEAAKAGSLQALKKDLAKRSKLRLGARSIDEPELPITPKSLAPVIPYDQARRELQARGDQQAPWAMMIDRLPLGLLVTQNGEAVYANRHLLEMVGHVDFEQFKSQMGTSGLFASNENNIQDKKSKSLEQSEIERSGFTLLTRSGKTMKVEAHIQTTVWNDAPATLTSIKRASEMTTPQVRSLELELLTTKSELHELQSVLDTATDGIILIDPEGRILNMNRSSEALFGFDQNELTGESMTVLFEPESHIAALDYLEGIRSNGVRSIMNDGRDVKGRERNGGIIPLFMTIGRVGNHQNASRFCIVLRDITHWKKVEADLLDAKRAAEDSSTNKTDFLATISHEIRTPLNAIIGFSQVMMTESFGPIGNERYKQYAKDINASGEHVVSLVNDLLDLSKVASGKLDLTFASVDMNAIVAGCVAMIQPQANAGKVIVRSQLASHLPLVVADDRAVRQIVINLLSNASKFTEAGGQVIASTSFTDQGEVVIRVRDTGVGMSEDDIKRAMEPFRQIPGPKSGGGTGLGLPLTKALVEANRAAFNIQSTPQQGTLVEVTFPSTRVLAE